MGKIGEYLLEMYYNYEQSDQILSFALASPSEYNRNSVYCSFRKISCFIYDKFNEFVFTNIHYTKKIMNDTTFSPNSSSSKSGPSFPS